MEVLQNRKKEIASMSRAEEYASFLQEEINEWLQSKYKGLPAQDSMLLILKLKEINELLTKQRQYARHGNSISTANLKQIRMLCSELIDMTYEIQEIILTHDNSLTGCRY